MKTFGGESACSAHVFADVGEPDDAALAELVRAMADAVVICDREGAIVFWNHAATALFGWSALDVGGKSHEILVPPRRRRRHEQEVECVKRTGRSEYEGQLLEALAVHRDGHTIPIAFTITLLHHAGQREPCGIAAVIRRVTARRPKRSAARAARATAGE